MKTGLFHFNLSKHAFIAFLGAMLFLMAAEPALASNTSGGGLPFTYRKLKNQTIPLSTPYAT
ncbi:hypothetical protein ACXEH3_005356 [Klebsiella variicola]